jgi:hypothetical protein
MGAILGLDWTSKLSLAAVCISLAFISAIVVGII